MEDQSEYRIVQRAIQDPATFSVLYELYFQRIYSYVAAKVNNQQDAEDVVSDIFLQAIRRLYQFRNRHNNSFAAWIFTIARNAVTDFYRRKGRISEELELEAINTSDKGVELDGLLVEQERSDELRLIIETLSERRQEVILLKYFSGLRNSEIAQILSLDERTVASHLSLGLRDLYESYSREVRTNEGVSNEHTR